MFSWRDRITIVGERSEMREWILEFDGAGKWFTYFGEKSFLGLALVSPLILPAPSWRSIPNSLLGKPFSHYNANTVAKWNPEWWSEFMEAFIRYKAACGIRFGRPFETLEEVFSFCSGTAWTKICRWNQNETPGNVANFPVIFSRARNFKTA